MDGHSKKDQTPTKWPHISLFTKLAVIAVPIIALLTWLFPSSGNVPPPSNISSVSIHVIDTTGKFSHDNLELRGPGNQVEYLDTDWSCMVDNSWIGARVRVLDGRTGVEITVVYLRPDSTGKARIWIR